MQANGNVQFWGATLYIGTKPNPNPYSNPSPLLDLNLFVSHTIYKSKNVHSV